LTSFWRNKKPRAKQNAARLLTVDGFDGLRPFESAVILANGRTCLSCGIVETAHVSILSPSAASNSRRISSAWRWVPVFSKMLESWVLAVAAETPRRLAAAARRLGRAIATGFCGRPQSTPGLRLGPSTRSCGIKPAPRSLINRRLDASAFCAARTILPPPRNERARPSGLTTDMRIMIRPAWESPPDSAFSGPALKGDCRSPAP
jgi:hypothetical protein